MRAQPPEPQNHEQLDETKIHRASSSVNNNQFQTVTRSKKAWLGVLFILVAVLSIGYWVYAKFFTGNVVLNKRQSIEPAHQEQGLIREKINLDQDQGLHRLFVDLSFQIEREPLSSTKQELLEYKANLSNAQGEIFASKAGRFYYEKSDKDDESTGIKLTSSKQLTHSKDFTVPTGDVYLLELEFEDLTSNADFRLGSLRYRLKSNVKQAPIYLILIGVISLVIGLGFFKQQNLSGHDSVKRQ